MPASADFVMYWWDKAAELVRTGKTERFGLITTNSIRQTFNRRVIQYHMNQKKPLSLVFAIPDHPWVDSADGAAVRIAMTLGVAGDESGEFYEVKEETDLGHEEVQVIIERHLGKVQADLSVGANVAAAVSLDSNQNISSPGVKLHGSGFIVDKEKAKSFGFPDKDELDEILKDYKNGRDITSTSRNVMVIDLFGLPVEEIRTKFPEVYQHVLEKVKPERDQNRRATYRDNWWIFGEARKSFRPALQDLPHFISTVETSKHRFFLLMDKKVLPDNKIINIALSDPYYLGVLSSKIHVTYSLAAGSWLGVGNDSVYVKTRCFETFPFPPATDPQKIRIRALAERLDAHRKRQQSLHPKLTMTGMYNVLEKERAGALLTAKERRIHQDGLVGILRELHDELDAAVAQAYGWPADLGEQEILQRLVDLNAERAAEEARGYVRWLRPEYQAPEEAAAVQSELELAAAPVAVVTEKRRWNKDLPKAEKFVLLRELLAAAEVPLTLAAIAEAFKPKLSKARLAEVEGMLGAMEVLGQADGSGGVWRG